LQKYKKILTFAAKLKAKMNKISQIATKYPLSLICIALIWCLCLFINMPETPLDDVAFIDKWTHFVMYGGTCSVIWWEYLRHHRRLNAKRLLVWAFLAPIAMSGLIEVLQATCTTTRQGEWLDFGANTIGVVIGNLIGLLMNGLKKLHSSQSVD
jgi:VanZ family protein